MGLGVLEDKTLEHVPGTVYVLDDASRNAVVAERDTHSKRDKTGKIILVPQPSDSPDDPLVGAASPSQGLPVWADLALELAHLEA